MDPRLRLSGLRACGDSETIAIATINGLLDTIDALTTMIELKATCCDRL